MGMKKDLLETSNTYWNQEYPEMWPLAYKFKEVYKERWVRFHSLPQSKRYAETHEERAIILKRHNTLLEDLNSSQPNVLLLLTSEWSWDTPVLLGPTQKSLLELDPGAVVWKSSHVNEDEMYHHVFISEWIWHNGVFDSILRLVANDVVANVMIVNISGKWLYHPYDGGADVILSSTAERNILRDKYASWLSKHPLGY
jgi:hypothetical protein